MKFRIEARGDYLLAEVHGRETAADMREFLLALKMACTEHACPRILISVHASRPIFKFDDHGLGTFVNELVTPPCRIALVGDSSELNHAHDYIELVARQRQMDVKSFRDLSIAQQWLREPQAAPDAQAGTSQPARRAR